MKTRFESDDDLPLDKTFSISDMIIVAGSVLEKNSKYYPQNLLHEYAYKLNKCCNTKILMFQKELTLIKQVHQKNICFVFFKDVGFKFEPHVCNKCHDVLMTAYELKNIAILNVKGVDFRCISWGISRDVAANRLKNSVLEDKGVL